MEGHQTMNRNGLVSLNVFIKNARGIKAEDNTKPLLVVCLWQNESLPAGGLRRLNVSAKNI